MRSSNPVIGLALILVALAFLVPKFSLHMSHTLILIFLFAYLSTAWAIQGGLTGTMSFGHSLFLGAGAYVSSLLFVNTGLSPWIGMLAGGLVAAILGAGIGALCFRYGLKGFFFGLITIVFAEIARYIALNVEWLGGAKGLYLRAGTSNPLLFQFESKAGYLHVIMVMYLIVVIVYKLTSDSKLGYYFVAIRESHDAAEAIGVDTFKYKVIAAVISASFTALGGSFLAQYVTFIDPYTTFNFTLSIEIVAFAVAGGAATLFGPLAGAALLIPIGETLRAKLGHGAAGVHLLTYGLFMMIVIRFMPDGILEWFRERVASAHRRIPTLQEVVGRSGE